MAAILSRPRCVNVMQFIPVMIHRVYDLSCFEVIKYRLGFPISIKINLLVPDKSYD